MNIQKEMTSQKSVSRGCKYTSTDEVLTWFVYRNANVYEVLEEYPGLKEL